MIFNIYYVAKYVYHPESLEGGLHWNVIAGGVGFILLALYFPYYIYGKATNVMKETAQADQLVCTRGRTLPQGTAVPCTAQCGVM